MQALCFHQYLEMSVGRMVVLMCCLSACLQLLWNEEHKDWLAAQAAKKAAQEAADAAAVETAMAAAENIIAVKKSAAAAMAVARGMDPEAAAAEAEAQARAEMQISPEAILAKQAAKKKKPKRKQKGTGALNDMLPEAQSAAEAARAMVEAKKLSEKINYKILDELFDKDEPVAAGGWRGRKREKGGCGSSNRWLIEYSSVKGV